MNKAYKLFSRKFIQSLLWSGLPEMKETKKKILSYLYPWVEEADTWASLGERILSQMKKDYRNEYVLKSELLNRYKNLQTLNEILIGGDSRTDFIVPHERGLTVYEIKSERDSLTRLEKQLLDYVPVFEHVRVLIDPSHFRKVTNLVDSNPLLSRVGVHLTSNEAYRLSKRIPLEELDFNKIFSCLWWSERQNLSDKPMYSQRKILNYWNSLPKEEAYQSFKRNLIARKYRRGAGVEWLNQIPQIFRPLLWKFRDLTKWEKQKLINYFNSPLPQGFKREKIVQGTENLKIS
jgi:hypothetical protein